MTVIGEAQMNVFDVITPLLLLGTAYVLLFTATR